MAGQRTITFEKGEDGALTVHVQGVKGKACNDVQKIIDRYIGGPSDVKLTAEYNEAEVSQGVKITG